MTDGSRHRTIYVTADSAQWMVIDVPDGMISPPTIDLHVPMQGSVQFYYAECYQLRVPKEAQEAANV